ncbi:hypothetical protein GT037_003425 [Alternaria burnsii]|uniref:Uncharacterized protein n=1 Tax=Alternaria burnsii TaxID=1187904 RepID=A0A8H7B6F6_9PLEO|nr:uncharacterized protein GT037_003425 [Alternaria burnsii]KAF7678044.1 hypothetical protein GT037_003425 [Alternaria burnsii]
MDLQGIEPWTTPKLILIIPLNHKPDFLMKRNENGSTIFRVAASKAHGCRRDALPCRLWSGRFVAETGGAMRLGSSSSGLAHDLNC